MTPQTGRYIGLLFHVDKYVAPPNQLITFSSLIVQGKNARHIAWQLMMWSRDRSRFMDFFLFFRTFFIE